MQPGYKNNQKIEPEVKSADDVKREREEYWATTQDELKSVNINQVIIKQNQTEIFGLEVTQRKTLEM